MPERPFPLNPMRDHLYGPEELFGGFDLADPRSYAETLDFRVYRSFREDGGTIPESWYTGMMRSLHDFSIWAEVEKFRNANPEIVAIMGGHKLTRDAPGYVQAARLARRLAAGGRVVASGGGPGAMEASHLGARFGRASEAEMEAARKELASVPAFPAEASLALVGPDGAADPDALAELHRWQAPVFRVLADAPAEPPPSLGIPTWHYGHEPATPLASHIAKYFQNSIREEGLLGVAAWGIAYVPGSAGTLQEIFQDAAQNHYTTYHWFSPMVFLDRHYWTEVFPVLPVLERLFGPERFPRFVLLTDDIGEAAEFLLAFRPDPGA